MSDLISREEAMVRIAKTPITEFFDENGAINPIKVFNSMCRSLADTPTIDAVPVIRCEDCKHKPSGTGSNHDLEFPDDVCPCRCEDCWYSWMPDDNWFCGDGERKEE